MKKSISLLAACAIALGMALPSFADRNGVMGGAMSWAGSTTATIIDVPEGILWDSLWRMPLKTQKALADRFGDDKGFQQNVAGAVIGIPVGFLWGIPYGAIHGGRHGMTVGWDKPFSTDSFVVSEEK